MQLRRFPDLAAPEGTHHLRHFARNDIRRHADDALRAHRHERQRQRIVAGLESRISGRAPRATADTRSQLPPASLMPMMFLHSARQAPDGFDADFDAATARNAVKHDGQSGGARDVAEMLEQPFLRRLVVIRRDLQRTVRADFLGFAASGKSPRSSNSRRCRRAL